MYAISNFAEKFQSQLWLLQTKKPLTVLRKTESQTADDEFPDIEYMPPPVDQGTCTYVLKYTVSNAGLFTCSV